MNQYCVPDFEMEDEDSIPTSSFLARKMKSTQNQDELFELIWQNGQIVMQNQNRKNLKKPSQKFQTEDAVTPGVQQTCNQIQSSATAEEEPAHELFMQDDQMASWLDYPLDDSFEGDFCSDLLNPTPSSRINQFPVDRRPEGNSTLQLRSPISPTRCTESESFAKLHNFKHFSRAYAKGESQPSIPHMDARESTVADPNDTPSAGQGSRVSTGARESVTLNPAVTSYSRCSGAASKPSAKTPTEDRKRKAIQVEDNESHSEDVESESVDVKKQVRGSARRVRSAEVHNLSERRRRDRINEKMKALQELIPHCDKSDKASMLDEAIEYLKSLQLQVQMMSMGFGMAPMRFPGVQQYMSPMGMGMGTSMNQSMLPFPSLLLASSIPTPASPPHMGPKLPMPGVQEPPAPISDSSKTSVMNKSDPALNSTGTEILNQQRMQNFCYPYPHYVGFLQMQVPPPQIQAITHPGTGKEVQTHENHQSGNF